MSCNLHRVQVIEKASPFKTTIGLIQNKCEKKLHEKSLAAMKDKLIKEILKSILPLGHTNFDTSYNNEHLIHFPNIAVSVSHTKNILAVLLANKSAHRSVGIDIELNDRQIATNTKKYFVNDLDKPASNQGLLGIWTLKEAAFKACSPHYPECKLLKQIVIDSHSYAVGEKGIIKGRIHQFLHEIGDVELIISTAVLD
mgnify:CR=1 FL=1|tara:strand:- start:263 stop:856 length:594 start_codon:yes stop_codon:yes gene_type:complete